MREHLRFELISYVVLVRVRHGLDRPIFGADLDLCYKKSGAADLREEEIYLCVRYCCVNKMLGEDEGAYAALREGFLECHRVGENVLLHILTGLLGAGGALGLVHACSNRSPGAIGLLTTLYAVALLNSTAPLALVLVTAASLPLVVTLVRWADLGECVGFCLLNFPR